MYPTRQTVPVRKLGKLLAAFVAGVSLATLLGSDPVTVPAVGTVPALLAGGAGLLVGGGIYLGIDRSSAGCGCGGACED